MEHDIVIENTKQLPLNEGNEFIILADVIRLEYGKKALQWVLSNDELLKPE